MRFRLSSVVAALALCTLALISGGCGEGRLAGVNHRLALALAEQALPPRPWLAETYPDWQVQVDLAAAPWPGAADLAGFPLGNGQVFAATGLHYPLGTLDNLMGPTYQRQAAGLGQVVPLLWSGSGAVPLTGQQVSWVRGAGVVRTTSHTAEGVALSVYDFAPPDTPALMRLMVVENRGSETAAGLSLALVFTAMQAEAVGEGVRVGGAAHGLWAGFLEGRTVTQAVEGPPWDQQQAPPAASLRLPPQMPVLRYPLGRLQPGQAAAALAYLVFTDPADSGEDTLARLRHEGIGLLDATREHWLRRLTETTVVQTGMPRLDDFLEIHKYLVQVQQAAGGGYSPMHHYTNTWIRDSNGPVRYLLACGDYESVRRYLDYQFRGYARAGRVSNNLPLDLDLSGPPAEVDWEQVPVAGAEISSLIILQRYWYWRHTGDDDLIREQWPMLRRCLLGQQVDEWGTQLFFGDETYRFPGYELFKAGHEVEDHVYLETRSLDSAVEHVAAAEGLAAMAPAVGRGDEVEEYRERARWVREATERYFWQADREIYAPAMSDLSAQLHRSPFAPVNLRPLWIGYAPPDARRAANVAGALRYLAKPQGSLLSSPAFGYYVPMNLGYLVYNLAMTAHPARDAALVGMMDAAERSGGFAEMNTPQDRPSEEVWGQRRFRPWEGGINAEAALMALLGAEVDAPQGRLTLRPWLPEGSNGYRIAPLRVGESRLSLELSPDLCKLQREPGEGEPITVDLHFAAGEGPAPQLPGNWRDLGGRLETTAGLFGGRMVSLRGIKLGPGQEVEVGFVPALSPRRSPMPQREEFHWGPPASGDLRPVVLLTWDRQTLEEQRVAYGDRLAVVDTKLTWPLDYLRVYLFREDGSRRAERVLADVHTFPGAFRRSGYWSAEGPGGKLLAEFTGAGGQVEWLQTGRAPLGKEYVPDI